MKPDSSKKVTIIFPNHFILWCSVNDLLDAKKMAKAHRQYQAHLMTSLSEGYDLPHNPKKGVEFVNSINKERSV